MKKNLLAPLAAVAVLLGVFLFTKKKKKKDDSFSSFMGQMPCPVETKNLRLNTINRNKAINADFIQYGPLNLSDDAYWKRLAKHWKTSVNVARNSTCGNCAAFDISPRMKKCMTVGETEDQYGEFGYCWMHKFKCHSARTCYTWAAGGAIRTNKKSFGWQNNSK